MLAFHLNYRDERGICVYQEQNTVSIKSQHTQKSLVNCCENEEHPRDAMLVLFTLMRLASRAYFLLGFLVPETLRRRL